jgi:hypothetical protein
MSINILELKNKFDLTDDEYKFIFDTVDNEINKKLFIPLINIISNLTGENFDKLCRNLGLQSKECGSIAFIDGDQAYSLAIVVVDPFYKHNLTEIRNSLSSEIIKKEFTELVRKLIELLQIYYICLQKLYQSLFKRLVNRMNNDEMLSIKHDLTTDTFYLTSESSRLGLLVTPIDKKRSRDIIENAININQIK